MADIQIIIGYETVTQADQAFKILDKTVKSTARQYEQAFNKITGWQKKFSNEQNKVNASLNKQHLAQQKSNKSARESAKAFEDAARAVEKEATALHNLRMATDIVYRNQQKRLQMKKLLKSAIAAETMSTEQAIVALKRYNATQASSNKVMNMAKNRMNGNNMAIQQLGYQFGDFAVQVQGGTSAFVAFSQQGAQLAGILPMIAGPLGLSMGAAVGLSAALGILIPIGSAVGRMFFEMSGSASSATKDVDALKEALFEFKGVTEDTSEFMEAALKLPFSQANEELKSLMATYKNMKSEVAKDALATSLKPLVGDVAGLLDTLNDKKSSRQAVIDVSKGAGNTPLSPEMDKKLQDEIKSLTAMQVEAGQFLTKIQAALKGPSEDLAENMLKVSQAFSASSIVSSDMRDNLHLVLTESGMIAEMAEIAVKREKEQAKIKKAISESESKLFSDDRKKRGEADDEKLKKLQRIRSLMGVIDAERIAREKKLDDAGDAVILQNQADAERALFDANTKYEANQKKLDAAGDKAILQAQADAERALFDANAKYVADQKALDAAGDKAILENNARIEIELFEANSKYEKEQAALRLKEQKELNDKVAEMATRLSIPFAAALNLIRQAKAEASVGLDAFGGGGDFKYEDATTFTPEGFGKKPKKAAKTDKEKLAEYLKGKKQEQILEKQLVGVLGEERQIQTELFNIKEKYAGVITPKQEKELENTLRLTQAERDRQAVVEEAASQQEQLADFIGDSMENAMMGIVDGTLSVKDAFKSMAAEIIKELYRVLVVQQMVAAARLAFGGGLFGGASWSADGDVVGSSGIQAYADGGVVNSPTMFKHGGGLGVMGEAGPEAIMPLKRGANGKLGVQMEGGGGDTINVVQNFSFQANGDDSVKRIIAQAAPQIAQMTKSSLLNDRRRGGATKAAFG